MSELPVARLWMPQKDLMLAQKEASEMEEQYRLFLQLSQAATPNYAKHFERELAIARRQQMDSNSFVVSLRRRGYEWAIRESKVKREIIDEEKAAEQEAELCEPIESFGRNHKTWSSRWIR